MPTTEKNSVIVELYELPISPRKDDRFGRVVSTRSLNEDDLIDIAVARGTELNPSTLRAALEIVKDIAAGEIVNGTAVTFGLAQFNVMVNGVFTGDNAQWNKDVNSLSLRITPTIMLRSKLNRSAGSWYGNHRHRGEYRFRYALSHRK